MASQRKEAPVGTSWERRIEVFIPNPISRPPGNFRYQPYFITSPESMQKKILKILVIVGALAYPLKISSQTAELPPVVITEIGAFEPAETEWIEIYNRSGTATDITDWKFFEDTTNHKLEAIRGDALLEPSEFAVIANKTELFIQKYPEYTGTVLDSNWGSLKEDGEEIGLKDGNGNFIELFTYPAAGTTTSLERIDVNFPANDMANWALNPISHSLGKLWEIPKEESPAESPSPELPLLPELPVEPPQPQLPENPTEEPPQPEPVSPEPPLEPIIPTEPTSLISPSPLSQPVPALLTPPPLPSPLFLPPLPIPKIQKSPAPSAMPPLAPHQTISPIPEQALFNLRGYFVFIPYEPALSAKKKEKKPPSKTPAKKSKKTKKKKVARPATKPAASQNGDLSKLVKITEIFPNPSTEDSEEEWIEIFNAGEKPVNLGNWTLADSKKTSPYQIPGALTIAPNSYAVFPKSETKIALNNFGDEILLRDFEGNIVDYVTYEKSKKGFSYALIHLKKAADLVASAQIVRPRQHAESAWEWIDEPTPGRENPTFEKLSGVVSRLLAGGDFGNTSFELKLADGKPKTIRFTPDRLDPLMAEAVLREGTSVEIHAREKEGMYELEKIQKVYPAAEKTEEKKIPWLIVSFIGIGILLNAIPLIRALREYFRKRAD